MQHLHDLSNLVLEPFEGVAGLRPRARRGAEPVAQLAVGDQAGQRFCQGFHLSEWHDQSRLLIQHRFRCPTVVPGDGRCPVPRRFDVHDPEPLLTARHHERDRVPIQRLHIFIGKIAEERDMVGHPHLGSQPLDAWTVIAVAHDHVPQVGAGRQDRGKGPDGRIDPFAPLPCVEPGHRGLIFNPRNGGLQHEVLFPGYHHHGFWGRIDDFDVTFYGTTRPAIGSPNAASRRRASV